MADLSFRAQIELIDRMTAPMRSISSQASRLGRQFGETSQAARKLQSQQGLINSFRQQREALRATSDAAQASRLRLQQLQQQMSSTANPTAALVRQFEAAGRESQRLNTRLDSQRQHLQQLRGRLSEAGVDTRRLSDHERELARNIERTNQQLAEQRRRLERVRNIQSQWQDQQSRWSNVRGAATGAAVGGALALSMPIRSFTEAEDAAMTLKVSMMNSSGQVASEFSRINALAERLGTSLPGSTAEFSSMMAKLVQQGISAEKILGGVGEASANLAVVMKLPFEDAAEFAAKMQDATRTSADDMLALMDTIQKSYYLGVDSTNLLQGFSKLADGMTTVRMLGLEGANAMAPFLIMADQAAMAGESAGNAYSKIFKGMVNTGRINKALDGSGISLDFTDGNGEFAGIENMYAQLEKLKPLSTEKRNELSSYMFGNDAEVNKVLGLLINKGQSGYDETVAKMQAQADLQQRVNAQLGTLANIWDAAKGTFTSAMVNFGEALAPDLKNLLGFVTDLSERLGGWAQENPELASTLMRIAGILVIAAASAAALSVVMLTILGPIALLKASLITLGLPTTLMPLTMLGKAISAIGTVIRVVGMAMMANPILIAIALLATAAFLIYQNWGPIKEFFITLWNGITAGAAAMAQWVSATWSSLSASVSGTARAMWQWLQSIFSVGVQALLGVIRGFSPIASFRAAFAAVWAYFSGLGATFRQYGANMLDGLKNGILGKAQSVINAISGIASRIKNAFTSARGMDIHSPSRVFAKYGGFMMGGLGGGILDNARLPMIALNNIARRIRKSAPGQMVESILGGISDGEPMQIDTRKSILPQRMGSGMALAGGMGSGNITININGATDPAAVAREVERILDSRERNQMARQRSRLIDID